ncbi:MAG: DUF58 domain-containing protein [Collinsella sp.]
MRWALPHLPSRTLRTVSPSRCIPGVVDIQVDPRQARRPVLKVRATIRAAAARTPRGFDLRSYREGDAIKSIHWKLSTRFDDVLVREASRRKTMPSPFCLACSRAILNVRTALTSYLRR